MPSPSFLTIGHPLFPDLWPSWKLPVNRERIYDFYAKEAEYFLKQKGPLFAAAAVPRARRRGRRATGATRMKNTWADGRWNQTDLGTVLCGIFRGAGVTVPKGVCVRLGDGGELAACFNPETLCYEALWKGGFVRFSDVRHGLMEGLIPPATALPRPEGKPPAQPFVYHGFYRNGKKSVFSYRDRRYRISGRSLGRKRQVRAAGCPGGRPSALLPRSRGGPRPVAASLKTTQELWARGLMALRGRYDRAAVSRTHGTHSFSSAATTFCRTGPRCCARSRATCGTSRVWTRSSITSAGAGMPAACIRRWDWLWPEETSYVLGSRPDHPIARL